jgi:hypothetical protein
MHGARSTEIFQVAVEAHGTATERKSKSKTLLRRNKKVRNKSPLMFCILILAVAGCAKLGMSTSASTKAPDAKACTSAPGKVCAPQGWLDEYQQAKDAQTDLENFWKTEQGKDLQAKSQRIKGINAEITEAMHQMAGPQATYDELTQSFKVPPVQGVAIPPPAQAPAAAPAKK